MKILLFVLITSVCLLLVAVAGIFLIFRDSESASSPTLSLGQGTQPLLVFVHGSPGKKEHFSKYFTHKELANRYDFLSLDRPGFGALKTMGSVPSIKKQAEVLLSNIEPLILNRKALLIGHSLGGPVVLQMALLRPEWFYGILLLAPSIDPQQEKVYWYQRFATLPIVERCLPKSLKHCNQEILELKKQLNNLKPQLSSITLPILLVHGQKDNLVPWENSNYAQNIWPDEQLTIWLKSELNHFFPFSEPDLVAQAISYFQLD